MTTASSARDVPAQPEFSRVCYEEFIADVRREDLDAGIEFLRGMSDEERERILSSVKGALDRALAASRRGEALDEQSLRDVANDIGIWFANEVLEGRAEEYRVALN